MMIDQKPQTRHIILEWGTHVSRQVTFIELFKISEKNDYYRMENKEKAEPTTPEGYIFKGVLYVVVGLLGKLLSDLWRGRTESPQGDFRLLH